MKKISWFLGLIIFMSLFIGSLSYACTPNTPGCTAIAVSGKSDPWLAGMPIGSQDNLNTPEPADSVPGQSPVLVPIAVTSGMTFRWTATGQVGHPGDIANPDGKPWDLIYSRYLAGAKNGISDIHAPIDSLLGVFLGPGQPNPSAAPGALDFSTQVSRNYLTLYPALQQVFFMGDGMSGSTAQTIVAPSGATWLYLGTMDGYGWANNVGEFCVYLTPSTQVLTPEPATMLLFGLGLAGLAGVRRFRNKI